MKSLIYVQGISRKGEKKMSEIKVERIPGVFPIVEVERDVSGLPKKVTVKGVMDTLEIVAHATPNAWLEVKQNGEDLTYG